MGGILALGVAPGRVLDTISTSVAQMNSAAPVPAALADGVGQGALEKPLPGWQAAIPSGRN
jgi:hypothetical protein